MSEPYKRIPGTVVIVRDNQVEKALRKLKKKLSDSAKLQELREREFYEKPTNKKKRAKNAARRRWLKQLASQELPKKLY
jgi:small subunit ribosomal protein S21